MGVMLSRSCAEVSLAWNVGRSSTPVFNILIRAHPVAGNSNTTPRQRCGVSDRDW